MTTTTEIADKLEGIEYLETMQEEARMAKASGIVICYGASDDLVEFDGAFNDETGGPGVICLADNGLLQSTCDSEGCPHEAAARLVAPTIRAIWSDNDGPCWTFKTSIPHEKFKMMEDGEVFCEGIVFRMADIKLGKVAT